MNRSGSTRNPRNRFEKSSGSEKIPDQAGFQKEKFRIDSGRSAGLVQENDFVGWRKKKMRQSQNHLKGNENGRIIPDKTRIAAPWSVRSGKSEGEQRTSFTFFRKSACSRDKGSGVALGTEKLSNRTKTMAYGRGVLLKDFTCRKNQMNVSQENPDSYERESLLA